MADKRSIALHAYFKQLPISDTCTWSGTTWDGEGTNAILLPCGEPTIGAGMFCDPTHTQCSFYSLCARHADKPISDWSTV